MKKLVLVFAATALTSVVATSQNVVDNKIGINYIQQPTNPLDKSITTYQLVVDKRYKKSNQDSLTNFANMQAANKAAYDAEMTTWKANRDALNRDYWTQMAAWETKVNAGDAAAVQPAAPVIPPQPTLQETKAPITTNDISESVVAGRVKLEGYQKGEGGAVVTVGLEPFQNISVKEKVAGSGTSTKYTYTITYQTPVHLKVEALGQAVIDQQITNGKGTVVKTFSSKYSYFLWWMDNKANFWNQQQTNAVDKALGQVNDLMNDKCGFPTESYATKIFHIKKYKDHDYGDLISALTSAQQGYSMLRNDKDQAKQKLAEAIAIWENALNESNVNDNKARINKKATAMLQANIAMAYLWSEDFATAELYVNKAINQGAPKFKTFAKNMQSFVADQKMRYNANN